MNEPQIDVSDRQRIEARRERLALTSCAARGQLCRDEDVLAAKGTSRYRLPHLFLVAIRGRRIDVSVANLECAQHRVRRTGTP